MNRAIYLTSKDKPMTSEYTTYFSNPVDLKGLKWNVSLSKLNTYYSWWNITSENNVFKYFNGVTDRTLVLEQGCYTIQTLVQHIKDKMVALGDYTLVSGVPEFDIDMELDLSDGDVSLIIQGGSDYTVDFTDLPIRHIFGFNSQVYTTSAVSERKSDIMNGVTEILLHCDLVSGNTYYNGQQSDILYSLNVNAQPNGVISIDASNSTPIAVSAYNLINSIRVSLTDQNGRLLNLHEKALNIELLLTPFLE